MVVVDCDVFELMAYYGNQGIDDYRQEVMKNPNVGNVAGGVGLVELPSGT